MTDRIKLDDLTSDDLDQLHERIEAAEELAEQHARNTLTVARERETYRKAWKEAQRMRAKAEQRADRAEAERDLLARTIAATSKQTVEQVLADVRDALTAPARETT